MPLDMNTMKVENEWQLTELIAANLDRLMTLKGLNNSIVGKRVGVSREMVRQWRIAEAHPSELHLSRLCLALQCSMDDLTRPIYASNLMQLMETHHMDASTVASLVGVPVTLVLRWREGAESPSQELLKALADVLNCTVDDIIGLPNVLPLSKWAKREDIPATRAKDLFELGILSGAISTPYTLLIPATLKAPAESKWLVSLTKRRPRWGVAGWDGFAHRFDRIMTETGTTNTQIAAGTGVNPTTVSHWRAGLRTPEEGKLPIIAKICGCSVEDLIQISDSEEAA